MCIPLPAHPFPLSGTLPQNTIPPTLHPSQLAFALKKGYNTNVNLSVCPSHKGTVGIDVTAVDLEAKRDFLAHLTWHRPQCSLLHPLLEEETCSCSASLAGGVGMTLASGPHLVTALERVERIMGTGE